jgi:Carboxypeptidase regulatory-like domain/TonB dependent receptor
MMRTQHGPSCTAAWIVLLFVTLIPNITVSQAYTGSIDGRVIDQSGGVVAHATVRIENKNTGLVRSSETGADGLYNFSAVQPGIYSIHIETPGFAPSEQLSEVTVASARRVDFTLGLRAAAQSVTVLGQSGVAIETKDGEISTTVSANQILQLPTLNRDPYAFVALSPGAGRTDPDTRGVGYAVNGQRTSGGNFVLDGGDNNNSFSATPGQTIPLDAVQEYRLQTNNYSVEYGRGAGFIANVLTKSGTNNFHGSVYEYNRNAAFAANTFDNNANGKARPYFNRNQVGGSIGGPIQKDKLFFFANYEGIFIASSQAVKFYVPTPQLLATSSPGTQAIFQKYPLPSSVSTTDVRTRTVCPYGVTCLGSSGTVTIPAFAAAFRTGPFNAGAGTPQTTNLGVAKVDYNLSQNTQIFFNYDFQQLDQVATVKQAYSAALDQPRAQRNQHINVSLTHTYSAHLLSESRFVYSRYVSLAPLVPSPAFPIFSIDAEGGSNLPRGLSVSSSFQNVFQASHTVTWNVNTHIIKFGGTFEKIQDNHAQGSFQDPEAHFADTQGFVNGIIHFYTIALDPQGQVPPQNVNPPFGAPSFYRPFRYTDPSAFVEDSWRANRRLTLYGGLRYEYFGVVHSAGVAGKLDSNYSYGPGDNTYERIANGNFVAVNNLTGDLKGRFYKPEYLDFSPRLGVAYDLTSDGNTVFRAGVGRFYDHNFGNVFFGAVQNPPAYATTQLTNVQVTPSILTDVYSVFPNGPVPLTTAYAQFLDPNLKNAYTIAWNAGVERNIGDNFVASAKYVGSSASHLYAENQINRPGSGVFIGRPNQSLNPNLAGIRLRGSFAHSTYNALQLRLESKPLAGVGLQFGMNYTYSHSIDNMSNVFGEDEVAPIEDGGPLNPFNPSLDKGSSSFDVTHLGSGYYIWNIPYAQHSTSLLQRMFLGGWGTSGLITLQSGMPLGLADTGVVNWSGNETTRPTYNGAAVPSVRIPDASAPNVFLILPINAVRDSNGNCLSPQPAPFGCGPSVNGPFTGGVLGRNTFRRPGTVVNNISFFKDFPGPRESIKIQLRGEFYNFVNHPNLYFSSSSLDVSTLQFNSPSGPSAGVVASFADSRQVVLALRVTF